MVRGRNDAQIFQDISHSRLSNGHILIHFGLSFRPRTSRRPSRRFSAQQQMYLFTAHQYLRWKPRRIKRAFGLYYKDGQYKYMDFTARLIPQFARYVKKQLKESKPDEALHWKEVTREDPTLMQELRDYEHIGLPQIDEQNAHQLRIQLERQQRQLQPGASGQHVFSIAESPEDTMLSGPAYSLGANSFSEYRAKSQEENKKPEGQHSPPQGVQHHTVGLDDEKEDEEDMESEEEAWDEEIAKDEEEVKNEEEVENEKGVKEEEMEEEEQVGLGLSERKSVPDDYARQESQWKRHTDVVNIDKLLEYDPMDWAEYVIGPFEQLQDWL